MKKIVVVEDSVPTLRTLVMVLERFGHAVTPFENAEDALLYLQANPAVDLIITDLHMPGMNGVELIREIKTIDALNEVPMLLLTAETTKEFRLQARDAGAQGWLVKPVTRAKLMDVLNRFL